VSNVRVSYLIHHGRLIVVFVQPQSFTLTNITSYVRRLSEAHTSEEDLRIEFISDEELLSGTLANLREMIQTFPFGNVLVPKFHCGSGPKPPLYAEYLRSSSNASLHYYPADGDSTALQQRYSSTDKDPSDTALDLVNASDQKAVRDLLQKGADPNIKTKYGESPLIEAAFWGDYDKLRLLRDAGAAINQTSSTGWTALMAASYGNREESFESLIDRGADINMRSEDGRSALILAVRQRDTRKEHTRIVERLLSLGADPNVVDAYGETPLGVARKANDAQLVRLLEQAGAK